MTARLLSVLLTVTKGTRDYATNGPGCSHRIDLHCQETGTRHSLMPAITGSVMVVMVCLNTSGLREVN